MKKIFQRAVWLVVLMGPLLMGTVSAQESLIIIAHPGTPVSTITRAELANIFMKRQRQWPNGKTIRPVNLAEGLPARELFLQNVLQRSSREMTRYWIGQKLYTGNYTPMQLDSEASVIHFVSSVEGGLGYVTEARPEELSRVKILRLIGGE